MDDSFGFWLAGLADGEGCFSINVRRARGYRSFMCAFEIRLRDDDRSLIELIHETLGFGRINEVGGYGRSRPSVGFRVETKAACIPLCEVFDAYPLRSKKAKDYVVWRAAVEAWRQNGRHRGICDWSLMERYACELREGRRYQAA